MVTDAGGDWFSGWLNTQIINAKAQSVEIARNGERKVVSRVGDRVNPENHWNSGTRWY
jgi:hypothetical protein